MIFVTRDGVRIPKIEWEKLQADDSYRLPDRFDNGIVHVEIEWVGKVAQPNTFRDYWPVFRMNVQNYRDGVLVDDPADDGETFPDYAAAKKRYEEFLVKWSECSVNDFGEFVEEGNSLAPPPPPNPDAPDSAEDVVAGVLDDGVGAW